MLTALESHLLEMWRTWRKISGNDPTIAASLQTFYQPLRCFLMTTMSVLVAIMRLREQRFFLRLEVPATWRAHGRTLDVKVHARDAPHQRPPKTRQRQRPPKRSATPAPTHSGFTNASVHPRAQQRRRPPNNAGV